jgi:hypothetical protein
MRPVRQRSYTLRSSSDPRGRLRGGAACGVDDIVGEADFDGGCKMGAATGGVDSTRACCTFPERPDPGPGWPTGELAFAIPMNVAGDSMTATYTGKGKRTVKIGG